MTQTASFKEKLKNAYSFFKWELKACSGTLAVYAILAAVFTTIILTLCIVIGSYIGSSDATDSNSFEGAITAFQYISSNMIYFMTIIFTIIYTIRVFSYLHNKRKADLYGSLPISRITLYLSKAGTAFVFSLVPSLFFLGIISIICLFCGQLAVAELTAMYIKLILGSLACISAYGLLAVCCGTSVNAVMMFIVVCIAYPLSAIFIRGVVSGFFDGFYLGILQDNFIMNALNPLAAYDGINIIYWIIFSVVCILSGCYLVRRRKAERAQASFAYYLPCHIIKVLVAFLVGMFLGVLFGSLNVLGYGYFGFVFGFILGSVPAFIISHLIFYSGFNKLIKTSIPLGGLIVAVVGLMAICNFDVFGYNNSVPNIDDVATAGFVDLEYCYLSSDLNERDIADKCIDDFDDKETISNILTKHSSYIRYRDMESDEKFVNVWYKIFTGTLSLEFPEYCFGYTLNNGQTITRVYSSSIFNDNYYTRLDSSSIISTKPYFENYGVFFNTKINNVTTLAVTTTGYYSAYVVDDDDWSNESSAKENAQSKQDAKKIIEAFRKDFEADTTTYDAVLSPINSLSSNLYGYYSYYSSIAGNSIEDYAEECPDAVCILSIGAKDEEINSSNLLDAIVSISMSSSGTIEEVVIPKSYTNTINALKEVGVLNDNLELNSESEYYR